ncbi:MAG: hypothetical protein CSA70_04475 [Rhodobacterales bacterium]|nr:MAG: hypothetical protein CSA70_04475 [Rhodobacterales bacterium]
MLTITFDAIDEEFAAATGSNVNVLPGFSVFDMPPNAFSDLQITGNPGDPDPRHFELGDTCDLTWGEHGGGRIMEGAVVVRSDAVPGGGGIIIFEGTDERGAPAQIIWTPGYNLEQWYWDNHTPCAEPRFYTTDTDACYSHSFLCFAADTRIATAMGPVAAGELWEGDHVLTRDFGPQPVQWIGRRCVVGRGANTPVLFAPGTIGNHAPLRLSPQHRVMIQSPMAEMMFAAHQVLVPAEALINGDTVRYDPCRKVDYVQLLLQHHHILDAEGAPCESLLYGDMARAISGDISGHLNTVKTACRPILTHREARAVLGRRRSDAKPRVAAWP